MKRHCTPLFAAAVGLIVFSVPAFPHHGNAGYDMTKTTTIKGTITKFEFINPHVLLSVDAPDEKGTVHHWLAETNSTNFLSREGWNKNTLKPGDQVTLIGHRAKNGAYTLAFPRVILASGEELRVGNPG